MGTTNEESDWAKAEWAPSGRGSTSGPQWIPHRGPARSRAAEIAAPLIQRTQARGQLHFEAFARCTQLPGIALVGTPEHVAEALGKVRRHFQQTSLLDSELGDLLRLSARLLSDRGLEQLAEQARQLAPNNPDK